MFGNVSVPIEIGFSFLTLSVFLGNTPSKLAVHKTMFPKLSVPVPFHCFPLFVPLSLYPFLAFLFSPKFIFTSLPSLLYLVEIVSAEIMSATALSFTSSAKDLLIVGEEIFTV